MRSFQVRAFMLMETLNQQERSFGNIIKLMVFSEKGLSQKYYIYLCVIPLSLVALQHDLLVDLSSYKRERMLECVCQNVKMMIIVTHNSKMLRKFLKKL